MIDSVSNNLSKEKIQQLINTVGALPKEDTEQVEATEYNWLEPHYYNDSHIGKIEKFAQKVAAAIADKFTELLNCKFESSIVSISQHYVNDFFNPDTETVQNDYYLPFGEDKCLYGLVGLSKQTAVSWASQLLGDEKPQEDSAGELSQLEESLLLDLVCSMVNALSSLHPTEKFKTTRYLTRGQWPLDFQGTEELCKITLDFKKADSEEKTSAYFLIHYSKLDPLAGKLSHSDRRFSDEEISNAILEHIKNMNITVTAQLASTFLTFEEIMNLQIDDIFLFDRRVDEPIELLVDEMTVCYGWPAKSSGQYALVVTNHADTAAGSRPDNSGRVDIIHEAAQKAKVK